MTFRMQRMTDAQGRALFVSVFSPTGQPCLVRLADGRYAFLVSLPDARRVVLR